MDIELARELFKTLVYFTPKQNEVIPFYVDHPIFESTNLGDSEGIFNIFEEEERFSKYLEDLCATADIEEDVSFLVFRVRKVYRLFFINYLYSNNCLSKDEAAKLIIEFWQTLENIGNDVNVNKQTILSFLRYYAKHTSEEKRNLCSFRDSVKIYRGCTKAGKKSFSWTLSEDKAEWFAKRFNLKGAVVCSAFINKKDIIHYFPGGEQEVVVDYTKLQELKEVRCFN